MKRISATISFGVLIGAILMCLLLLACGGGGGETTAPNQTPVPTQTITPEAPTNLQAQAISQSEVNLTWSDKSVNEDGFYVERKRSGGVYARVATLSPNVTSYDDDGLTMGTTYTYRVRAYTGSSTSNSTNEATATTQGQPPTTADFIINHQNTGLVRFNQIPAQYISMAKNNLHIAYGHTSHGSQIITGMAGLNNFTGTTMYSFNNGGFGGALDLRDTPFSGASDLGDPNRTAWATATRTYLNSHPEVNVVMWSWCGQVSTASAADIVTYLTLTDQLEQDYPDVKFVYMTGHLDGTGVNGNLHQRNEQIRAYCRTNNKILYDFADIESFDPDGVNFLLLNANDGCNYAGGNWAIEWQTEHPTEWYNCTAAHTQPLNANLKAYAAWWLWARLAGWTGP